VGHDSSAIAGSGAATESRSAKRLGSYTAADRALEGGSQQCISAVALCLTDAAFFEMFPQQQGKKFINQPIAQVWHAIATDKLNPIIAATTFQRIVT